MNDTKLIRLIKTFNKEELKSFEKFLKSPFFKPTRKILTLYEYITKFYPNYGSDKLEKKKVFKKLFSDEEFNEKKISNLIYDLTKAAEDFLAHNTLKDDKTEYLLNLSKGYLLKNLPNESFSIDKIIEKKLHPGFSPGKDYISKLRRLTYLKSSYYTERNDFKNIIECKKNYFEASAVQFIIDYIEIVSSQKPAQTTYGKNLENYFIDSIVKSFNIEKLLKLLEKSDYTNKFLIALHYYRLKTIQDPENINYYFLFRDLFYKNISNFDREEKSFIFNHLVNYCVQKVGKNLDDFKKEGLEVYKKMLNSNAYSFSETGHMHAMNYRNIVQFCFTLRETKWFEYFIEKYSDCLNPEHREDLRYLSYSYLYFMRKEFEKALVMVSKINHEFFIFKADLKNLMLKIYYELNYFEQAFSMVYSYKSFLQKTKEITKPFKEVYGNFLKFYFELLKIKSQQNKKGLLFIKNKIEKENKLVSKRWLLEKSDQLAKPLVKKISAH